MHAIDELIRRRAYELWDRAGRPNGRGDEFWFAARAHVEFKEGMGERKPGAPVRRRVEVRCESAADWGKRGREPSV